ncbi:MAG: 2-(1,2-epoxy-1,2-dihydrophenyl)acetyl-CoA isomerase [Cryomorphaceae bacterium]|jgi:2-(1,2-epoxy-1,2-dihydrophenyl)acetyl-CoA isomerase
MTKFNNLDFSIHERVATIAFNRPDAANGLNLDMATELADAARICDNDENLKAVVLTGNGRFFCAGGDVKAMLEAEQGAGAGVARIADELHKALSILARMDLPLICSVNGTAAGAGFSIAVTGDLVIAAESAKFTMAYSKIGLSPDGSSSYYLPRLIGIRRTQELMFTNRVLSAQEALGWGLVTKVVADDALAEQTAKLAQMLVNGSKGSNAAIKSLLLESFSNSLETQMEIEGRTIAACARTVDGKEGVSSFVEKRAPKFS